MFANEKFFPQQCCHGGEWNSGIKGTLDLGIPSRQGVAYDN